MDTYFVISLSHKQDNNEDITRLNFVLSHSLVQILNT